MDRMNRFHMTTLGCKVNQCESASISAALTEAGYQDGRGQAADVVVINSCAVTARAAMQSRQAVRHAIRVYPEAAIVVTGCYAQIAPETLQAIDGVHVVVGHHFKLDVQQWLACARHAPATLWQKTGGRQVFDPLLSAASERRTRAFLKIQDGCNTHCAYCVVPLARGRSRSMPKNDVIDHLTRLGQQGIQEVVLTGIHIGAYGADFDPPVALADLLSDIEHAAPIARWRLSSIEPTEIDPRILSQMADPAGGLCPHAHIPLQSGDDTVLRRMGRPYSRAHFAGIVADIHRVMPQAAIGADVLVGFPGEDEAAFANTFSLIEELPLSYLHVFPYSVRPGTVAASFKNKVHSQTIKARCRLLRSLGEKKRTQFHQAQLGSVTKVLVETAHDRKTGLALGTSENYLTVAIAGQGIVENSLMPVRIERQGPQGIMIGSPITAS